MNKSCKNKYCFKKFEDKSIPISTILFSLAVDDNSIQMAGKCIGIIYFDKKILDYFIGSKIYQMTLEFKH